MTRKFDSEIMVNSSDKWIFRGNEIHQEDILNYFRKNLKQDSIGVYIDNRFGELAENGYVLLQGYPYHVTTIIEENNELIFETDRGIKLNIDDVQLFRNQEGNIVGHKNEEDKILFRFSINASTKLSEWLEEDGDEYKIQFQNRSVPLPEFKNSIEISLPSSYEN
ncbi:hypothetical protein [Leptospira sp. GIMC2001]|uniref:hypothetical protein n=1 Tax=Leptospira sp. GIMC2001 TaxID=1513297 RepID=UPI00234A00B5|nr:hypothetical protein [Leptospira sp. GIMC2001]WCL48723.1 hypothetical protein O4O04_15640 [Leptospira sp. GIMC2001]